MPAEVPSIEPTEVIAGDTVAWTKDLADYSPDTYTLNYYLRGPANINITATDGGNEFSVSVTAAVSATWPSGLYQWQAFVSSGSERYKVGEGEITILANPQTSAMTFETKSTAKQILEALDATILRASLRPESSYSIQASGFSQNFKTLADLIVARDKFASIVQQEEDAKKLMRGENTGKNILFRFS